MDEELLRSVPLFSWLPQEAPDLLNSCFNLEVERLSAGESRQTETGQSERRAGCLLEGSAVFQSQSGERRTLTPGALFAIAPGSGGSKLAVPGTLTAGEEGCAVVWFNINLTRDVCYCACWFHVHLLQKIDDQLNAQKQ